MGIRLLHCAALAAAICVPAQAATDCNELRFALAVAQSSSMPSREQNIYARAIIEQEEALAELDMEEAEADCRKGASASAPDEPDAECIRLLSKRGRMVRNLEILRKKSASIAVDAGETVGRLERELHARGCTVTALGSENGSLLTEIPKRGDDLVQEPEAPRSVPLVRAGPTGTGMAGGLHTICVRTCDGGFFPISAHASSWDFGRHAEICARMCAGTDTELFYHGPEEDSSAMRSALTGLDYNAMGYAHLFRTAAKPIAGCGCDFAGYHRGARQGQDVRSFEPVLQPSLPNPIDTSRDMADRRAVATPRVSPERDYDASRPVRVVGPRFLPDDAVGTSGAGVAHPLR